ncbi:hypothetical protein [Marimonas arenosa]|uniref:Uncharacterized protein n=1 Tax=Marimonas arenosa TaxID=1795305 RepID=A0AAE4B5F9_9RHOB|nr:hypothetical protein [Marimonas arenosa]MDQ2091998.1 hypothetical protein [Marimonas arenosa]
MFGYYAKMLWALLSSVPAISPQRIWPLLVFLMGFVSLRNLAMDENTAFVFAAVIAQVVVVWRNLPEAAAELRRVGSENTTVLNLGVAATIAAAAVQLWMNDPAVTQHVLSVSCLVYALAMLWGALGHPRIRELVVPSSNGRPVPEEPRTHLLRLNVMAALTLVVVNEAMVLAHIDLAMRVSILAVVPLLIHVLYEVTVILTLPLEDF